MRPIEVKNAEVLMQLLQVSYDRMLIQIVLEILKQWPVYFTCGFRNGDSGVHGVNPLCRGLDLRYRMYLPSVAKSIEDHINATFQYDTDPDPERAKLNCCRIHGEGHNKHIHLQSHPNTIRR